MSIGALYFVQLVEKRIGNEGLAIFFESNFEFIVQHSYQNLIRTRFMPIDLPLNIRSHRRYSVSSPRILLVGIHVRRVSGIVRKTRDLEQCGKWNDCFRVSETKADGHRIHFSIVNTAGNRREEFSQQWYRHVVGHRGSFDRRTFDIEFLFIKHKAADHFTRERKLISNQFFHRQKKLNGEK